MSFNELPADALFIIFNKLPDPMLATVAPVCTKFYKAIQRTIHHRLERIVPDELRGGEGEFDQLAGVSTSLLEMIKKAIVNAYNPTMTHRKNRMEFHNARKDPSLMYVV